jgi:flagellar assembly factor FliW
VHDHPTEVTVPKGLCGFPESTRYALTTWGGEGSPYRLLRSLDVEGLEFVVVDPALFFADYVVELDDADAAVVGIDDATDAVVYVIVTLGDPVEESTANLLGPLVVHRATGVAVQAVQVSPDLSSRTPLFTRRGPLAAVSG